MRDKKTERIQIRCSKRFMNKLNVMSIISKKSKTAIIEEAVETLYKSKYKSDLWKLI